MPELTVTLNDELAERVRDEAKLRGLSSQAVVEALLGEHLLQRVVRVTHYAESIPMLVSLLGSPLLEERQRVKTKLIKLGDTSLRFLREGMKTDNPDQARGVAEVLARTGSSEVVELLLNFRYLAPQEARADIDLELRGCLQRYGMSQQESHAVLDRCRWQLVPLVARWLRDTLRLSWPLGAASLEEIQKRFDSPPTEEDTHTLLVLLQRSRTGNMTIALTTAQLLQFVAETAPTPSLRQALRLLRPSWRHPFPPVEFTDAARAIELATEQWKDLPLPAESGDEFENHDLPVPVDNSH